MITFDRTFIGNYEVTAAELPGAGCERMFWYPEASQSGGKDGVVLRVEPVAAQAWFGMLETVGQSSSGSHVLALPDRVSFAVVAEGACYRVNAHDAHDWGDIPFLHARQNVIMLGPPGPVSHCPPGLRHWSKSPIADALT